MADLISMYVWRELPSLKDYSNGLLCVIAESYEDAIHYAVQDVCGTAENQQAKRALFEAELRGVAPSEVLQRGAAYVMGSS